MRNHCPGTAYAKPLVRGLPIGLAHRRTHETKHWVHIFCWDTKVPSNRRHCTPGTVEVSPPRRFRKSALFRCNNWRGLKVNRTTYYENYFSTTLVILRRLFAQFKIPKMPVTDRCYQFAFPVFVDFCQAMGIKHLRGPLSETIELASRLLSWHNKKHLEAQSRNKSVLKLHDIFLMVCHSQQCINTRYLPW